MSASPLPGTWTLYFHAPREKRWTLDTFQPIATLSTLDETLAVFKELGDKIKRGMFFCMRNPIPPLWENHQNIRGGSYSIRGSAEHGPEYYKAYIIGAMTGVANVHPDDNITGISISPKIMTGPNGTHRVGFYVIKVWNKDSERFNKTNGIHLLHQSLVPADVLYTPHVDKKM
jgi:Eukaryotic initiation factor 4E